jgi:hypothetical protein
MTLDTKSCFCFGDTWMLNRRRRCESMSTPHTPNLGLYQFIFRSKPMLEAYLNFQKICRSWIFQNLQKIRGFHERTDGFLAGYLICYNFFWKPWLFIKIGSFILLRAMVMNNIKNLPDNCGGGVCFLFLSNYLTVVQSPNPVRLWELDNHKRTLQIMLAARTRGGEERARVNQHPPQCGWVLVHPRVEKRAWNSWVLTLLHLIYKSKHDVCLSVCHDK